MEKNRFEGIPNEIALFDPLFPKLLSGRRVVVDVGCGHGDFLLNRVFKEPETLFIGIEIARKRANKASHRLFKRHIENYRVIAQDGELALKCLFPDASADEIHINFPEPWQKDRQWKNRIVSPLMLIQIVRILKMGGVFNFVTDVAEYAEAVSDLLTQFTDWIANNYDEPIKRNLHPDFPTLFFQKMSPLRDVNYLSVRKIAEL